MGRHSKEIPIILNFGNLTEEEIALIKYRFSAAVAESDLRDIMRMPPEIREYVYNGLVAHCQQVLENGNKV